MLARTKRSVSNNETSSEGSKRGDGGNDEETRGVGGSQRGGAMIWNSEYYATQDTDHGTRAGISQQRRHLN